MEEKRYVIHWPDGPTFSVPLPYKEAEIMRKNAELFWCKGFYLEEVK